MLSFTVQLFQPLTGTILRTDEVRDHSTAAAALQVARANHRDRPLQYRVVLYRTCGQSYAYDPHTDTVRPT